MKKAVHITITLLIMLLVSVAMTRITDGAVQIDDDIGMLVLLLAAINGVIGAVSYKLYRAKN